MRNLTAEPDTISFDIPGGDVQRPINVGSTGLGPLPDITTPMVVDGYTQAGAAANTNPVGQGLNTQLRIELSGNSLGAGSGLVLRDGSDGTTIRGLAINRFPGVGVFILGGSGHTIAGNFIGTDVTGQQSLGNVNGDGVAIQDSPDNVVGGTTTAAQLNFR